MTTSDQLRVGEHRLHIRDPVDARRARSGHPSNRVNAVEQGACRAPHEPIACGLALDSRLTIHAPSRLLRDTARSAVDATGGIGHGHEFPHHVVDHDLLWQRTGVADRRDAARVCTMRRAGTAACKETPMSRRTVLLVALALLMGSGPAWAQKVKTDFDPSVSFGAMKTYYWAKTDPVPNDLMNQRLMSAVDHWLTAKGWIKVGADQADLAVVPVLTTQQGQTLNTFYDSYGGGWGYRGWGATGFGSSTTTVNTFTQGTLVIDLFERQSKRLIWRGTATDTISDDPKKNAEKIQKATEKMFKKNFPPGVANAS
jgi:hypothetical protein